MIVRFQQHGGLMKDLFNLTPDEITPTTVAHALALKNRFTGHTKFPYNVAQHCVEGANLAAGPFKLPFLLHELDEVFLQDIHGPLKPSVFIDTADEGDCRFRPWAELGAEHATVILKALGLSSLEPLIASPEVKVLDWRMLATERRDLMDPTRGDLEWILPEGTEPFGVSLYPKPPLESERQFLALFEKLTQP
jgi:hypothetical protein